MVRFAWLFVVCVAAWGQQFEILNMGVFSAEKPSACFDRYQPLARWVAASLNDEAMRGDVKLRIFQRERELVEALRSGRIHFAPLHPVTYFRLKDEVPELILVAGEWSPQGFDQKAVIVTPKSVSVRAIEQLKGRGFAFGPLNDALYDWAVRAALVEAGITRGDLMFKNYSDFDHLSELVQVGRYQAGVLPVAMIEGDHPFRVLAEVEAPGRVWVMVPDLLPFLQVRISTSLLDIEDQEILRRMGLTDLREVQDTDLDDFRRVVSTALDF